ncbi:MAG: protein kinase [Succinimonas sp.]|nr:protein kinase [Succinimonas sp.]
MSETKINSSLSSKFKKTQINSVQRLPDITGLTLDEFHVDTRLDIVSGEADIYLCSEYGSHSGKKHLLKYYRRENAVKPDVLEKLKTVKSPFVAPVEGYGEYQGHQYVVRPYYEMSALSELLAGGTRFSEEDLKSLIIPSIIEGLKAVHDAGILHKDLKPANLIPDDAGKHIVLIDFGISSDAGNNTFVVTQTGMTPFYAAPEALQGIFHRETDYYALGITVFELFTGFTPFQNPGLSPEEAARLASVSKIEFPESFPAELKNLVLGLTYKDISHRNEKDNPNRRWGYSEVKKWLNGETPPLPGTEVNKTVTFIPYLFKGVTYTEEMLLFTEMLKNPKEGIRDLGRGILSHHYSSFDKNKCNICQDYENKLTDNENSNICTFNKLIYQLLPSFKAIYCNGIVYADLHELADKAVDEGIELLVKGSNSKEESSPFCKWFNFLITNEVLKVYASVIKSDVLSKILNSLRKINKNTKCSDIDICLIFGYSLSKNRKIAIHGRVFENPRKFYEEMILLKKNNVDKYIDFLSMSLGYLERLISLVPENEYKELLTSIRADVLYMTPVGSYIKFGNYGADKTPIEWLVLKKDGSKLLIISRYVLGYHEYDNYSLWRDSSLREYLNNDFFNSCFSKQEQDKILEIRFHDDFLSCFLFKIKNDLKCLLSGIIRLIIGPAKEYNSGSWVGFYIILLFSLPTLSFVILLAGGFSLALTFIIIVLSLAVVLLFFWMVIYPLMIVCHSIYLVITYFIKNEQRDRVSCLSAKEVQKFLKNSNDRKCGQIGHNSTYCKWWLRYPIKEQSDTADNYYCTENIMTYFEIDKKLINCRALASVINEEGSITHDVNMNDSDIGVRPVMWISV